MKQKVYLEIETTEFQKVLEQEVEAYVKKHLRSMVDGSVGKNADNILETRLDQDRVDEIVKNKVVGILEQNSWMRSDNLKSYSEKVVHQKVNQVVAKDIERAIWHELRKEVKEYAMDIMKEYTEDLIKDAIKDSVKQITEEQILEVIKENLAKLLTK